LQPERWESPLFQEKYRGEKFCDKRKGNVVVDDDYSDDDDDNNNNNNNNFDRTVLGQWYRIPWYNFQTIGQTLWTGDRKIKSFCLYRTKQNSAKRYCTQGSDKI
jgi:hypothetical protein